MTIYPAGTQISGLALRIADQAVIKVGGQRFVEIISTRSIPSLLPAGIPLTLGHGPHVGDTENGDGHQVGTVDFYRVGIEVRFAGQLTEPVDLQPGQPVSVGMVGSPEPLVLERSSGLAYRIPLDTELRHLALVKAGAYDSARVHRIGPDAEIEARAAVYARESDELEELERRGQLDMCTRPAAIVSVR